MSQNESQDARLATDTDGQGRRATAGAEPPAPPPLSGGQENADLAAASVPGSRRPGDDLAKRQDRLLDETVEETFPASDPISPKVILGFDG